MINHLKTLDNFKNFASQDHSLIEELIKQGVITNDQLYIAQIEAQKTHKPLDTLLIDLQFISDELMADIKAQLTGQPIFRPEKIKIDLKILKSFSKQQAQRLKTLPLFWKDQNLHIAVCEIENLKIFDRLKIIFGEKTCFITYLATTADLLNAIDLYYIPSLSAAILSSQDKKTLLGETISETLASEFLDNLFENAIKKRASDIHFEPEESFVCVRFRIDGVLKQICSFHQQFWPMVCVRAKILSNLNIAESRLPQDGRFSLRILGREIDIRVSCLPTYHGESIVLRILDKYHGLKNLEGLGFNSLQIQQIKGLANHPEGILIVTGPTGSGKTTTLYSIVQHLACDSLNIMTLEDPVEYELKRIRQTEVKEAGGVNFAEGIRAILRQDPDIILIGETRDEATAKMAIRASMTGHLVLTTLHTQNALGVFSRLYELGLTPQLLEGNLRGIIAQRLLRKLCLECRKRTIIDNRIVFKAYGCDLCEYTGYWGRTNVVEILSISSNMNRQIVESASLQNLKKQAQAEGMTSLFENAYEKIYQGETSFEEVHRVLGYPS